MRAPTIRTMEHPLTVVIFGATGDLFKKKLARAFFDIHRQGKIAENLQIFGFSRRELSDNAWRTMAREALGEHDGSDEEVKNFLSKISFRSGDINKEETYEVIKNILVARDQEVGKCSNKLFYLGVTPDLYKTVFRNLSDSGLTLPCAPEFGSDHGAWIRILVEKPFGTDQKEAESLDNLLGKLFMEDQIFRIDDYLAKEIIQNILAFRFSNTMFESLWSRRHIKSVHITSYEISDNKDAGAYYDSVGALKDMGQNHLLQMLAAITMEKPETLSPDHIRRARATLFQSVSIQRKNIESMVRGQYEGYLDEPGIDPNSRTETYFKTNLSIENERWKGVPFIIEHGKALHETGTSICILFDDPHEEEEGIFPDISNELIFHVQPDEGISISFFAKKSGFEYELEKKTLSFSYKAKRASAFMYPYEKLLIDSINGDRTLFVSTDEVREEWRIVSEIMKVFDELPLYQYAPGAKPEEIGKAGKTIAHDWEN